MRKKDKRIIEHIRRQNELRAKQLEEEKALKQKADAERYAKHFVIYEQCGNRAINLIHHLESDFESCIRQKTMLY
mgnify:CR=1 FL=1